MNDAPFDDGVVADTHVRPEHAVSPKLDVRPDPAVVTDERRADDLGRRMDLGARPDPDPRPEREARHVDLDLAVKNVGVRPQVGLERADVLPVATAHIAVERTSGVEHRREHFPREVDGPSARYPVEDLGLEHVDAGVDGVAEDLAPPGLLEEALDTPVGTDDDDAELEGVLHGLEGECRDRALLVVELDERRQVDVGEDVSGDDEESVVQFVAGVQHRAGRPERGLLGRVDEAHAQL